MMLALVACGDDGATTPDATSTDTAVAETVAEVDDTSAAETTPDTGPEETVVQACEPHEPACSDQQISTLQLSDEATGGDISEEGTTPGVFVSHVDATAGGFNGTLGYTYARFTETGLVAVDLSDEDALESSAWDIAFRRFVARLNSGVSGPSCVTAARLQTGTEFGAIKSVPANLTYHEEAYFTGTGCTYVDDGAGIGSPGTVLSSYWRYVSCVRMTGDVFIVALADGRHVKVQFLSYYTPAVQEECDEDGSAPTPNGAGNVRVQWAFLD